MIDYYKILNVPFGASENEIKKRFRKLATIHHPDKNGGSVKSEETFKVILNAYTILSDKEKRGIYDKKYKQHFQIPKSDRKYQNNTNSKHKEPNEQPPRSKVYQEREKEKHKVHYIFWVVLVFLILLFLYKSNKTSTTGNPKADQQLEEQKPEYRPQSGELDFNK